MYALLASIPILTCIVLMVFFHQSAKKALIISWFLTCIIAGLVWQMGFIEIVAQTLSGFLNSLSTILIIFGAILLMNTLKQSGAMHSISLMFGNITSDARIQLVLIGFVFAGFIEGSSGFGTPAALAAPILIGLGFPPLAAATLCLIYNSTPVNPGPVGVPLLTACTVVKQQVVDAGGDYDQFTALLTKWICIPNMIGGVFIIFMGVCILCKVYGRNHSFKDALSALPFCLLTAAVIGTIYIGMAFFGSPELVSMTAFICALPILMLCAHKCILTPKDAWTFDGFEKWGDPGWQPTIAVSETKSKGMKAWLAWLPYVVIGILLVMTRLNAFGLKGLFNSNVLTLRINGVLGIATANWDFAFLYNPGIFPFIPVCILTVFLHHMSRSEFRLAVKDTCHQFSGAAIALLFGVAMVQLYRYTNCSAIGATVSQTAEYTYTNSSMLYVMAHALANLFSGTYFVIAPLIGILGAFMSGSCTVSNILFASLQFETASIVGLSQVFIVALQSIGGGIGNMICVNNIVAVCATTGTNGNEGKIIKVNIFPCLIYAAVVVIVIGLCIFAGVNPMPGM